MSPSCHWLHHSSNPEHYNCNYGATYTLWDRVFGTYLDERHINNIYGFGVENTQYNKHHPIYAMYFLPLSKSYEGLENIIKKTILKTISID